MIYNHQIEVPLNIKRFDGFAAKVAVELRIGRRWFDIAFVDDPEIQRLNRRFRHRNRPTDVLSFPWACDAGPSAMANFVNGELAGFLGDVIISAPTAFQDAADEGITLDLKISQLILHGVLHLLGYDHEADNGEMRALEQALRSKLGIDTSERGRGPRRTKRAKQIRREARIATKQPSA